MTGAMSIGPALGLGSSPVGGRRGYNLLLVRQSDNSYSIFQVRQADGSYRRAVAKGA